MSLDQLDNVLTRGKTEEMTPQTTEDPEWVPGRPMKRSEVQKMWEQAQAEEDAKKTAIDEAVERLEARMAEQQEGKDNGNGNV